jgi:2-dehydropantoate 2-reductase
MRIAVMGAGAVGGYFGALLARAGHDVSFIARGAHMQAMRERGLVLDDPRGRVEVKNITVTDDAATLAPCDVTLFCVKTYDTESAAALVKPLVAKGGVVISLQNGVDGQDRIAKVIGADKVMGGLAFVSGVIAEPGVLRYTSNMSSLRFGEPDGSSSPRAVAFRDACRQAGFTAELMPDIRAAQWQKFVGLCTNAALTSLIRLPAGNIYHDPELLGLARKLMEEIVAVAKAQGIALPADIVDHALGMHQKFPPTMYASMYHDHCKGRRTELESMSGMVLRRGRELGVPTPAHEFAYLCLKPHVNGAPLAD